MERRQDSGEQRFLGENQRDQEMEIDVRVTDCMCIYKADLYIKFI